MRQRNRGGGKGTDTSIASISSTIAANHHHHSERTRHFPPRKPVLPVTSLPV